MRGYNLIFFHFLAILQSFSADTPFFPGTEYDEGIPRFEDVLGFAEGEKVTFHHEALAYAHALAAASPKVIFMPHGESWEGRAMGLLIITSEANHQRLEQMQKSYQAIADPRLTDHARFEQLAQGLPALVWFQESVHGDEISPVDSGLVLAWHLAAARDGKIKRILENAICVIDIMLNPDGRDRFVTYHRQTRTPGMANPDPRAAERMEGWPSGRFNHYLFDMNRDWIALTQKETRARVMTLLEWYPQVVVDIHEIGFEGTFFAVKTMEPFNPYLSKEMLGQYSVFGKVVGAAFDSRGYDYFHSERFDSFYPGYGGSWPSLHGAVGMLFEQGGARGLKYRRRDGTVYTYRDAITHHSVASMAVLRYAAENRAELLAFFYRQRAESMRIKEEEKAALLLPSGDQGRALSLARLLVAQGIEVLETAANGRAEVRMAAETVVGKIDVPEGTLIVPFQQPAGRLARTLLLDHIAMDEGFLETQDARAMQRQRQQIYDVTAWSLPLVKGVPTAYIVGKGDFGIFRPAELVQREPVTLDRAELAYLMPRNSRTGLLLSALLNKGIHVHMCEAEISHEGKTFPRGSLIVKRRGNPVDLHAVLSDLGRIHETVITATATGWFEKGPSLGSEKVRALKAPRIALLWGDPTRPLSAGWMRYAVEQQLGYPLTVLESRQIGGYDLSSYDVILMPDAWRGEWSRVLRGPEKGSLEAWIRRGGVLVAVGGAVEWLVTMDLLPTQLEPRKTPEKKEGEPEPFDMLLPQKEWPIPTRGVLLRARFDTDHWLTLGMPEEQAVMVASNRILEPLRLNQGRNPGRFASVERLLMSGYIYSASLEQFAHKPFLMLRPHGEGKLICFTEDPHFRGFMDGLLPLFVNAVFLAPSR